jgi:hypothetical protein
MKKTIFAIAAITLGVSSLPLQAQTPSESAAPPLVEYANLVALNQAKNLARQAAERANGGLNKYRAEPSMHGPAIETPHEEIAEGVWRFTFQGNSPTSSTFTIESVVVVDTNTDTVSLEYNGPIR